MIYMMATSLLLLPAAAVAGVVNDDDYYAGDDGEDEDGQYQQYDEMTIVDSIVFHIHDLNEWLEESLDLSFLHVEITRDWHYWDSALHH